MNYLTIVNVDDKILKNNLNAEDILKYSLYPNNTIIPLTEFNKVAHKCLVYYNTINELFPTYEFIGTKLNIDRNIVKSYAKQIDESYSKYDEYIHAYKLNIQWDNNQHNDWYNNDW